MSTFLTETEPWASVVRDAALQRVQDEQGVRVEDYLTVLAAATGEAAIVASGVVDIEHNDLTPGAGVFGDAINQALTGDATELASVPAPTVVGVLRDRLGASGISTAPLADLQDRYRHVAASVGQAPWGDAVVRVVDDHRHRVLPLQVAFELRPAVVAAEEDLRGAAARGALSVPAGWGRHSLVALALALAVEQTRGAIDVDVALDLALDVVFAMAKTVPMSQAAFEQSTDGG